VNPDGSRSVDRDWDQSKTWKQMEEIYASGKVKAIGVSNWSIPYLEDLKKTWKVVPAVNQVELHPYNPQHKLKAWCENEGILLESYCPLGSTSTSVEYRASSLTPQTPRFCPIPSSLRSLKSTTCLSRRSLSPTRSTGAALSSPNRSPRRGSLTT
jgi:diketogulonate reductase-like aldo/keto reductase